MLAYKLVENKKFNKVFREYYMTQGDTFQNSIKFTRNGENVTPELAQRFVFHLLNADTNVIEYEQEWEYDPVSERWLINIPTTETSKWDITSHIYEYEVTYKGGVVKTLAQAKFVVTFQGQEE